jgi:hypothetical protein
MITNKYEAPPNYQPLRQQRLQQIQEDYFPPPQKNNYLFSSSPPRYIPTALYQPDYDDTFDPQSNFEVRISVKLYTAIIALMIVAFFFIPVPKLDGSFDWMAVVFMLGCLLGAGYSAIKILDRKTYLTIDENGLHFYKNRLYIPWEHIVATHFYTDDDGESSIYKLVIDYIDAITGTCKTELFSLTDYDKSQGEIALAITWYQKQYWESQKTMNLHTQTT